MKLNAAQKSHVEKLVGVEALPEEHPAVRQLSDAFGSHTFFLDAAGLHIVEEDPAPDNSDGRVVRLASWRDADQKSLLRHEPEVLPIPVDLAAQDPDPAA